MNKDLYEQDSSSSDDQYNNIARYGKQSKITLDLPADFEDSSIDEDMAFTEDDIQRYGDMNTGGKKRKIEEESDEDDDMEMSEDENDIFMSLSDMLESDGVSDIEKHQSLLKKLEGMDDQSKKKRRIMGGAVDLEGEFNVSGNEEITLNDLMGTVASESEYSALRLQMERLIRAKEKRKLTKKQPKYIEERNLRKRQYDETVTSVSEWEEHVKHNREAAHISFPIQPKPKFNATTNSLKHSFQASTDLEKSLADIIKISNISEHKIMESEALMDNQMDIEDLRKRDEEISKLKNLLFHKERKLRRQKKIKSRKYRAIRRKQKEKNKLSLTELEELDPDAADELREKIILDNYKERMTLKHKRFGKWAQAATRAPGGKKQELQEHYERGKLLRKKIDAVDSDSSDFEEDEFSVSSDDEALASKGVMGMAFMQRALRRENAEVDDIKQQMIEDEIAYEKKIRRKAKQIRAKNGESISSDSDDANYNDQSDSEDYQIGRKKFTAEKGNKKTFNTTSELEFSGNSHLVKNTGSSFESTAESFSVEKPQRKTVEKVFQSDSFPTVQIDTKSSKTFNINKTATPVQDFQKEKQSKNKKQNENSSQKKNENTAKNNQNAKKASGPNPWMKPDEEKVVDTTKKNEKKKNEIKLSLDRLSEVADTQNSTFNLMANVSEEQTELIQRAFASDDVQAAFREEKNALIDGMIPVEDDGALPGWGDWGGEGVVVKVDKRKEREKKLRREQLKHEELSKRPDSKLQNVIINMKSQKNLTKYTVAEVPYPYTSRAAYERAQRHPIGPEWNSSMSHSAIIKPKITVERGSIIEPIKKTKNMRKNKRKNL